MEDVRALRAFLNGSSQTREAHRRMRCQPCQGLQARQCLLWLSAGAMATGSAFLRLAACQCAMIQRRWRCVRSMLFTSHRLVFVARAMLSCRPRSYFAHDDALRQPSWLPPQARFPLFSNATGMRVRLLEGESLYLPAFWWHSVAGCGVRHVAIASWFRPTNGKFNPASATSS